NDRFTLDPSFAVLEPAGPPTVAINADGRLDVFYRLASGKDGDRAANVGHTWQLEVGGRWTNAAEDIGGHGGIGPIAAANAPSKRDGVDDAADARIMLFQRNRGGGISMTKQVAPNSGYEQSWTDTGRFIANEPAVISGAYGWMFAL